jgi:hypothetical protein
VFEPPEVDPAAVDSEPLAVDPAAVESEPPAVDPSAVESELPEVEAESDEPDVEEAEAVVAAVDVVRADGASVVPVVCCNSFWTPVKAWSTKLMAEVIEVTAVAMEAFSSVVQVTVDDTEEISTDRVAITVASGKEVTMEINVVDLVMTEMQEIRG